MSLQPKLQEAKNQGFDSLVLTNGQIQVCVVPEHCTGGRDRLPNAKKLGEYAVLAAKQKRDWKLELLIH